MPRGILCLIESPFFASFAHASLYPSPSNKTGEISLIKSRSALKMASSFFIFASFSSNKSTSSLKLTKRFATMVLSTVMGFAQLAFAPTALNSNLFPVKARETFDCDRYCLRGFQVFYPLRLISNRSFLLEKVFLRHLFQIVKTLVS